MLKEYIQQTTRIHGLEPYFKSLKDVTFKLKTNALRLFLKTNVSFNKLLPYAFASFKEACYRLIGLRLHDTQLLGGLALCSGKAVEMKTGEGKTLAIAAAAFACSLFNSGVHIVVPSDHLTKRDSELTQDVFEFLGTSVGKAVTGLANNSKRTAYNSDITYVSFSEHIFDYLQDHLAYKGQEYVQRRKQSCSIVIVDEVDSILIDEAETPFIVSTSKNNSTYLHAQMNKAIKLFVYETRKAFSPRFLYYSNQPKQLLLTELGFIKTENLLINANLIRNGYQLYTPKSYHLINMMYVLLKAYKTVSKDRDYIIRNGEVIIIAKLTGRLLPNKRWSNGVHLAVETKEALKTRKDSQAIDQLTLQSYFSMYSSLSGITGTANETQELKSLYNLETVVIPTNKPQGRYDEPDRICLTVRDRIIGVIRDIQSCYKRGQPVLVGTQSVEQSEELSVMLNNIGFPHELLNAKSQLLEPIVVANAGKPNKITITSCIAGRGTNILLGGLVYFDHNTKDQTYFKSKRLGGLRVIGIGRHNLRKADVQLIGRAGRQGEAGTSCFYVSLKDRHLNRLSVDPRMLAQTIESIQKRTQTKSLYQKTQLASFSNILDFQRYTIHMLRRKLTSKTQSEAFVLKAKKWPGNCYSYSWSKKLKVTLSLNLFKRAGAAYSNSWFSLLVNLNQLACIELTGIQKRKELEKSLLLGSMDSIWMNHLRFLNSSHWNLILSLQPFNKPHIQYIQNTLKLLKRMVAYLALDVLCLSEVGI
ncbi:DEAD/DEAH box helicase [Candidatus Tremblaya phenacola]|uniref:preprotein translocase subunit SecA n=1 Tax=Candidatus Tremblayella phenacoccinincola TaxID=1010676 RepID=UPI001330AB82|nr:DEAD/DEAH box helicase [Candidatus Tremblaya phenacola]KAH0998301.1 Protein translocase subunit SecA [Candidatus Tremblaya phenacola]